MSEIYISVDVEAGGPIPGPHSMWSLGAAAFRADGTVISTYQENLVDLPGAVTDPDTWAWWCQPENAEALKKARENPQPPEKAMPRFVQWVRELPGICLSKNGAVTNAVMVAYPALYDGMWVYWYLMRFAGESPFSFSALDIQSYASAVLKLDYREAVKRNFPKSWFPPDRPHTHVALDDALEQGELFLNIRRSNLTGTDQDRGG